MVQTLGKMSEENIWIGKALREADVEPRQIRKGLGREFSLRVTHLMNFKLDEGLWEIVPQI
jgi:hypothetical protein